MTRRRGTSRIKLVGPCHLGGSTERKISTCARVRGFKSMMRSNVKTQDAPT
eukprot:CAMPEP_0184521374 /NCGR_PEP_ID=MMETSP0198_2-20121128/7670_1 /TAXON_ID=1112570 /ORGANISM="Thraustochytrium sp., Strain LLF1b" /LENGTH=50 /DNA_ID=CAMNT_0026912041 /DNA_START=11 /DNA_END=163 /DNA_ORIENTATION=+